MKRLLIILASASLLAGCGVSKQLYAEKEAALAACQTDLGTCNKDRDDARAEQEKLRSELNNARTELDKNKTGLFGCESGLKRTESELKKAQADLLAAQSKLTAMQGSTGSQELNLALKACRDESGAIKEDLEKARREAEAIRQQEADLRKRLEKELADKNVEIEKLKTGVSLRVLDSILFDQGTAEIKASGAVILDKVAGALAGSKDRIRVEGHTDDMAVGPTIKDKWPSNWELSAARAASVVRYFQWGKSIDPARMEAVGKAQYHPVAPNDKEANRIKNRRVEIILTPVAK
ncbi:hypothetical protein EPN96_08830 [bacterium]|nr:MAG: hypothetical protein EPN96_08830 [bacterium]